MSDWPPADLADFMYLECVFCGRELEPREQPEGFCDACLRAHQTPVHATPRKDKT